MDSEFDGAVMRATVVLLVAGLSLVAAGTAGVAGSPLLALALGAVGAALRALATTVDETGGPLGVRTVATDVWVGPVLAAVVVALWLDASPGEVQALGGIVGLVGMLNYFLRPFYHLIHAAADRIVAA